MCRCCNSSKHWKVQFSVIVGETMEIAELVCLDFWRLLWFSLRKSVRFMLTVVDNYWRRTCVFALSYKFDAFIKIRLLRALIKMETNETTKDMWNDTSVKFYFELFNEFCEKEAIVRHHISVSESHKIAKLMSRMLLQKAHRMLSSSGIIRNFS